MSLKLNDFEGFGRYLFGDHDPNWNKFYDKENNIFMPPILCPKTEAEYQLNHYTFWMVIAAFKLSEKPLFHPDCVRPMCSCYACGVADNIPNEHECADSCPLDLRSYETCGEDFDQWSLSRLPRWAYNVAHIPWRDIGNKMDNGES